MASARPRGGHDYSGKCKRETCHRKAIYPYKGFCKPHYESYQRQREASGELTRGFVDTKSVVEHIEKLQAAGIGAPRIQELSGIPKITLWRLKKQKRCLAETADIIFRVPIPSKPHTMALDGARIDSTGTKRRLRALYALGYPRADIAQMTGLNEDGLSEIVGRQTKVTASVAKKIEDLYENLQLTPGPSDRMRKYAARKGWHLPLAWNDDIDDAAAEPFVGEENRRADQIEHILDAQALGRSQERIAADLGMTVGGLRKKILRAEQWVA